MTQFTDEIGNVWQRLQASHGSDSESMAIGVFLKFNGGVQVMKLLKAVLAGLVLVFASAAWAGSVDINSGDAKAFEALNGIGPAKAQAIVDYRTKNGPFKSVDELEKVPGIGPATVTKIRDSVTVGGKAQPPAKPDKPAK